jgi:UDP-N-acetylmuramoyl-L-alanyl-D-glutamate--2,6-diaminopimelate ligase
VGRGEAFVAVAGAQAHGMAFARQAESRGAAIVIHDGLAEVPAGVSAGVSALGIPAVCVPGLGGRLSSLGARYFHNPSERLTVAGVTGTNGNLDGPLHRAGLAAHGNAGLIGTVGCLRSGAILPT